MNDAERLAARPPEPSAGTDCLLRTRHDALADHVALIAAAAGAVLRVEREPDPRPGPGCAALLLGPDGVGSADGSPPGTPVILTGYPEDAEVLWRAAARRPGARVAVLPQAAAWLGEFLGELGLKGGPGTVRLFAGAAGGAGTTTTALLHAAAATLDGARTLFIDADPFSPGVWPLLGGDRAGVLGWEDLARSHGRMAPSQLAEVLPLAQGTAVLSWSERGPAAELPGGVLHEVVAAARRIYDLVVVDAGRAAGTGPSVAALADEAVAVLPARRPVGTPGAPADAQGPAWTGAVVGRLPAGSDARAVAAAAGLGLAAYVPWSRAVERAAGEGRLVAALSRRSVRAAVGTLVGPAPLVPPGLHGGTPGPGREAA
ncbi:hypothetical protein ACQ3I4_05200 [Zafaria sp. Z1313]|uniref:hypothetical protein n=1 Tax=Zafaria sp. Z1313 TaxID=3423202 RepID=UPI003D302F4B